METYRNVFPYITNRALGTSGRNPIHHGNKPGGQEFMNIGVLHKIQSSLMNGFMIMRHECVIVLGDP